MAGGTRSYEMARRLVANGHEVNMVTSWREEDERKDWFVTDEAGIRVHWLPVPYSNKMSHGERIRAFFRFAVGATPRAGAGRGPTCRNGGRAASRDSASASRGCVRAQRFSGRDAGEAP